MSAIKSWAWPLFGVTAIALACSGTDSKSPLPSAEAGAAGDSGDFAGSGGSSASTGGASGEGGKSDAGATSTEGGAFGAAGAGDAGAGGDSASPLSLSDLAGDWSGTLINTYVCESNPERIDVAIEGSTVTTGPWPSQVGTTGTIAQQAGGSFALTLPVAATQYTAASTLYGQLYVDPSAQYALFVTQEVDQGNDYTYGNIAILQRDGAPSTDFSDADLVGHWAGVGVHLDQELATTDTFDSQGSFYFDSENQDLIHFGGVDVDGEFSADGVGDGGEFSAWTSEVTQNDESYGGIFLLSDDKRVLATALLKRVDKYNGALCDLRIFADMSVHRFALWNRSAKPRIER